MCQSPLLNEQTWHLQDPPSLITVNAAKRLHKMTHSYLHCICSGCWLSAEDPGSLAGLCEELVSPLAPGGWSAWPWEHAQQAMGHRMTRLSGQPFCGVPNGPQQTCLAFLETFVQVVNWCEHKTYLSLTFGPNLWDVFSLLVLFQQISRVSTWFFSIMLYYK